MNSSKLSKNIYQKHFDEVKLDALHGGLETAVLSHKIKGITTCSIGPNIINHHSVKEACEIASFQKIFTIVLEIVQYFNQSQKA